MAQTRIDTYTLAHKVQHGDLYEIRAYRCARHDTPGGT